MNDPQNEVSQPHDSQQINPATSLAGPIQLFKQAWAIYVPRFWTFIGIMLAPFILIGAIVGIIGITATVGIIAARNNPTALGSLGFVGIAILIILVIGAIIVGGWSQVSMLYAVKDRAERIGFKESYRRGWKRVGAWWWLALLSAFVIFGGVIMGIIPGIIFAMWFSLSGCVLVSEELRGMDVLMKSKEYVRGRWWGIFGRYVAMQLIVLIGTWLIPLIAKGISPVLATIIQIIASIIGAQLVIIYNFLIYENLRAIKGATVPLSSKKGFFVFSGILGIIIIPLAGLTLILLSLGSAKGHANDITRTANLLSVQAGVELYYLQNNRYPLTLEQVATSQTRNIPTDPVTSKPYQYTVQPDGTDYTLCAQTESTTLECFSKDGPME